MYKKCIDGMVEKMEKWSNGVMEWWSDGMVKLWIGKMGIETML